MLKNSKSSVIESKLNQKPFESKKAIYAAVSSGCVLLVFAVSSFIILKHAETAREVTELANLVVMFFAALATTLITGQAVVDFKGISALQHIDEDEKIDSNAEAPEQETNVKIVKSKYYDDGSL